jgi:hypothetical protein
MAELFEIGVNTVNYHLKAIFADGELRPEATIRYYRIVRAEGVRQITRQSRKNPSHRDESQMTEVGDMERKLDVIC